MNTAVSTDVKSLNDIVRDKVKETFVNLIPEDQWNELVKKCTETAEEVAGGSMTNTSTIEESEFDFWTDRLNIRLGGYSGAVDEQIYNVAKLIVEAREADGGVFNDAIADKLGLSRDHVELIQYILASISMPVPEGKPHYSSPFTYGTSPRGLFVDDLDMAKQFLAEFETYMKEHWGDD